MSADDGYDVVIVGGGLYGACTAWHLLDRAPDLRVCIVEADPGYAHAASARSNAGVRVQFSQAESIHMSRYGHAFYAAFAERMSVGGEPASLDLYRRGYLLMATTPGQEADLRANLELQLGLDCEVEAHDRDSLARRFPALRTDDVRLAVHSPQDMWIDPVGAVNGLMRKVRALGAELVRARVKGFVREGARVTGAVTEDGAAIAGEWIVNATGAWAPALCAGLGIRLPVVPLPIMVFYFETRAPVDGFGVTIDVGRVSFRPEGRGFISVNRRMERAGSFHWDPDPQVFEAENWPRLAHRVPAFEAVKVRSAYGCHYAHNHFDGNLLLGAWPGGPENFLFATGASGHGLQHAPAAGRALAEQILFGRHVSLDLGRFGPRRVVENRPDPERGFRA